MTAIYISLIATVALLCQWLAWRVRFPAILFLLIAGLIAGPISGVLHPDALFGDLLFPLVSLCVAVILFEGSLTLDLQEIRNRQGMVKGLVTVGALVTWAVIAVTCQWLFDLGWAMSILFGALTVVTGPTVIAPMLRTIRPRADLGNILRWEGILIDPIGALLVVVVYEFIVAHGQAEGIAHGAIAFLKIIGIGTLAGVAAGWALTQLLSRNWLPQYLQNLAMLACVMLVFSVSNLLAHESGLLAVTLMGAWLANQKNIEISEILEFKEQLSLVLISGLFILLAARLQPEDILGLGWAPLILLVVVQFVARPLSVWISAIGSSLTWKDKAFLGWIAPRGIVAAAVSALFAIKLEQQGYESASLLVPLCFCIIFGTVIFQSATAKLWAKLLGVNEPANNGFLLVGANPISLALAEALNKQGLKVLVTDTEHAEIQKVRMAGIATFYGNAASEYAAERIDLTGIGRMLAVSADSHMNSLAAVYYAQEFGADKVYALQTSEDNSKAGRHRHVGKHHSGPLFDLTTSWTDIMYRLQQGDVIKATRLSDEYGYDDYLKQHGDYAMPLMSISADGKPRVRIADEPFSPDDHSVVISLYKAEGLETPANEVLKADDSPKLPD
ncbi:cation:proton antiporter [Oceanobacter kriegii]|uniref:cation:proton antiporter n=1 Tax=Oceanobacter kriegii TaxID=64972 RepID=UPI0004086A57|nr:sodium:proton antiporter [Oceanobacter kriegii]